VSYVKAASSVAVWSGGMSAGCTAGLIVH